MKRINVILVGFGNVGKAFLKLVREKRSMCRGRYGLDIKFHSIFDLGGALVYSSPFRAGEILETLFFETLLSENSFWRPVFALVEALESVEPGVLVECMPSNIKDGEPGLTHIRQALENRWHVVTSNKGPLVVDFRGLKEKAEKRKVALKFSGATAAALPTLDIVLYSLAGADIFRVEGILNGTTNFILTKMKEGIDYEEVLKEAQAKGIVESDPSLDVEGWDTASKILLIANAVLDKDFTLNEVKAEGITTIPPRLLRQGNGEGNGSKIIGENLEGKKKAST